MFEKFERGNTSGLLNEEIQKKILIDRELNEQLERAKEDKKNLENNPEVENNTPMERDQKIVILSNIISGIEKDIAKNNEALMTATTERSAQANPVENVAFSDDSLTAADRKAIAQNEKRRDQI